MSPIAQDPLGHAIGVEGLEAVQLFANADELDRAAGDVAHRQRGTAARIAVQLGQHHAGQGQGVIEGARGVDRVLAQHGVDHEQGFDRLDLGVQRLDFLHHGFVDTQAACRIDDQHVVIMLAGPVHRRARDVHRFLVGLGGEEIGADLLGYGLELGDSGGAVDVARDRQHLLLLVFFQPLGQLADSGGLAGALQAGHEDDRGRLHRQVQLAALVVGGQAFLAADDGGQLALHHAHQRLARRQAGHHVLAQCLFLHAGDEFPHHRQGDVGLQHGQAHFAQHFGGIGFGQASLAAHGLDDPRQALSEIVQHGRSPGDRA